jgi:hypothetical protein
MNRAGDQLFANASPPSISTVTEQAAALSIKRESCSISGLVAMISLNLVWISALRMGRRALRPYRTTEHATGGRDPNCPRLIESDEPREAPPLKTRRNATTSVAICPIVSNGEVDRGISEALPRRHQVAGT